MSQQEQFEEELRAVGALPDGGIDIAETALLLAALERPMVSLDRYRADLQRLVDETARSVADDDAVARAAALRLVIADRHDFAGDSLTYDDLQNANLMRVMDRRRGLPIVLGILYLHCARRLGWSAEGLNFPAHFVIRVGAVGGSVVLDPFAGGLPLDAAGLRAMVKRIIDENAELRPEYLSAAGNRQILLRLQNNIKVRALGRGEPQRALAALRSMTLFAPDHAAAWREQGLLQARLGNLDAAVASLETYLERAADGRERYQAALQLQRLRRQLN